MCNYEYLQKTGNSDRDHCQIQTLFDRWPTTIKYWQDEGFDLEGLADLPNKLPEDDSGHCIFHSRKLEWKYEQGFDLHLEQFWVIIEALDAERLTNEPQAANEFYDIDMRECCFIGTEMYGGQKRFIEFGDISLKTYIYIIFIDSEFIDAFRLVDSNLEKTDFDFKRCAFKEGFQINKVTIGGLALDEAKFQKGMMLSSSRINKVLECCDLKIEHSFSVIESHFLSQVFFNGSGFNFCGPIFDECVFYERLDFSNVFFDADVTISNCHFQGELRFQNTIFQEPLDFFKNEMEDVVLFQSTSSENKIFLDIVRFSVTPDQITGSIIFENVNFMNILEQDRLSLVDLARSNKVLIGKGCIKYRLQSADRILYINDDKQAIIVEFAHAFANYFVKANGTNLGVEIREKNKDKIIFFYFSDENITQKEFELCLQHHVTDFLSLLSVKPQPEKSPGKLVSIIDSYASLIGVFLKVGMRISSGRWDRQNTSNLLAAVNFSDSPLMDVNYLHQLISTKFNPANVINYFRVENANIELQQGQFLGPTNLITNKYHIQHAGLGPLVQIVGTKDFSESEIDILTQALERLTEKALPEIDRNESLAALKNTLDGQLNGIEQEKVNKLLFENENLTTPVLRPKYHAFLSFSEEDTAVAEALYEALMDHNLNVWFSRVHLKTGDSIIGVINEAISRSAFGIVLLSESTFEDDRHFPIVELDAMINNRMYRNIQFLPIYHKISHSFVLRYSPLIADIKAANTNSGIAELAEEMATIILAKS